MRLTPLDIRKQEFTRNFRGYDAEEVHAFLQMLANQWEELQDENRRREEKIRELDGKLRHYEKVEEALQEALQTARESSRKTLQNAEEKATMLIDQAEARADEIKREAERERHELKRETVKLSGRRSEIVTRLRAFLMSEMELLARYEGDDPVGFIKLLPMEEKRMRRLAERTDESDADEPPLRERQDAFPASNERDEVSGRDAARQDEGAPDRPREDAAATLRPDRPLDDMGANQDAGRPGRSQDDAAEDQDGGWPDRSQRDAYSDEASSWPDRERAAAASQAPSPDEASFHRPERDEEVMEGPGWTARTVVSRPSEQQPSGSRAPGYEEGDEEDDSTSTHASSEEIEKIRRILSDLD